MVYQEEDSMEWTVPSTPARAGGSAENGSWSSRKVFATPYTAPARMHNVRNGGGPGNANDSITTPTRGRTPATKIKTVETDKRRLDQRAKQVVYGKATLGYRLAKMHDAMSGLAIVNGGEETSATSTTNAPRTPRSDQKCSKRCWDAQVREWRVRLHAFDPKSHDEWRSALEQFPAETLELAAALDKNATQFSATQCMPPDDIMEMARREVEAAAKVAPREPVARSLKLNDDDDGSDDENE